SIVEDDGVDQNAGYEEKECQAGDEAAVHEHLGCMFHGASGQLAMQVTAGLRALAGPKPFYPTASLKRCFARSLGTHRGERDVRCEAVTLGRPGGFGVGACCGGGTP